MLELAWQPGVPRPAYRRKTAQLVVFLQNCTYERVDALTEERTFRQRSAGEVLWHAEGEEAPELINAGSTPFNTLLIELK